MKRLWLKIHGRVQGVFFRESVRKQAEEFGLVGWVRNAADGTVEIHSEGEEESLKKLRAWCRIGPLGARVERVEEEWKNIKEKQFQVFSIIFN